METEFYRNSNYKPVEMTKHQLIDHLTKRQDACYDEELTKAAYRIPGIFKKDFAFSLRGWRLPKTVFVFSKAGTDLCGGYWRSEMSGTLQDPVKITVAIKLSNRNYNVLDFDWDDSFFNKMF